MAANLLPDRRGVFKGLAVAALIASPAAASAPAVDRSAWDAAVAAHDAALGAYDAAEDAYGLARGAYDKARPAKPRLEFTHYDHEPRAEFDRKAAELKAMKEAWQAADAACRKAHRLDELDAALNQAASAISKAFDDILFTAAPDLAAVVHKIELAVVEGIESVDMDFVLSDLRRLGGLSA